MNDLMKRNQLNSIAPYLPLEVLEKAEKRPAIHESIHSRISAEFRSN